MLKALKSASKRTHTRLLAAALVLLAALAAAVSIYAATDSGSSQSAEHPALSNRPALAKNGVEGLHEGRAPAKTPESHGHESTGVAEAGTALAAIQNPGTTPSTGDTYPSTGFGAHGDSDGFHGGSGGPQGNSGGAHGHSGHHSGDTGGASSPKGVKTAPGGAGKASPQEAEDFSISGAPDGPLAPGAAPSAIALTLANPNDVTIHVTSLQTTVSGGAPGCAATKNVLVTQAAATSAHAIAIPAHATVTLPAQGISAPTIQMLDLAVNQDACANAQFKLQYSGRAES